MRADRDHDHTVIARPHDRTAAGKSVTGRPGRRRNDESVRSIFLDQMPVDGKIQPCQLPDLVMPDDDIIQHAGQPFLTAILMLQDRVQKQARLFGIMPRKDLVQTQRSIFDGDAVQKSQLTQVDPCHQDGIVPKRTRRSQEGAVAADGEQTVTISQLIDAAIRSPLDTARFQSFFHRKRQQCARLSFFYHPKKLGQKGKELLFSQIRKNGKSQ